MITKSSNEFDVPRVMYFFREIDGGVETSTSNRDDEQTRYYNIVYVHALFISSRGIIVRSRNKLFERERRGRSKRFFFDIARGSDRIHSREPLERNELTRVFTRKIDCL